MKTLVASGLKHPGGVADYFGGRVTGNGFKRRIYLQYLLGGVGHDYSFTCIAENKFR
jgi:hypothetical protein